MKKVLKKNRKELSYFNPLQNNFSISFKKIDRRFYK